MRFLVDTNLLIYAVNADCVEHQPARTALQRWLFGTVPWSLTWGIVYEFLRVVTHPRVFREPLDAQQALSFLEPILAASTVTILTPTERHQAVLLETIEEFGKPTGNIFHDLHTATLMREHGVSEIMTADVDFRKFTFLTVTDPVHGPAQARTAPKR